MKVYIKDIQYYVPERRLTNEELVREFPEWSVEKVASKLGVQERRIAAAGETATDMAVAAARKLLDDGTVGRDEIDFVLLCTQSPDYFLPTSACLIQNCLGLRTDIGALDFNLGCSGFVYGLSLAKGLIAANVASNVLLLTAETYSKHIHPKDKGNRTIFGDGAAATLVARDGFAEIGEFSLGTDGRGANNLIVRNGAVRNPQPAGDLRFDEGNNPVSSDFLYMNGAAIVNFTLEAVPTLVTETLKRNALGQDDIDLFVFHQANKYILNFIRKKIHIPEDKFYYYLESVGNTVSSTIPIALFHAREEGASLGNVLLAGFGVGYSWGGTVLRFDNAE